MRSEMPDRPVSLAAALEAVANRDDIGINTHNVIAEVLRSLPTFAPATHGGREVSGEAMEVLQVVRSLGNSTRPSDVSKVGARVDQWLAAGADIYTTPPAPTRPPREMPAPEWTGPDRWQVWSADASDDQATAPADDGYTPIGAWKLVGVGPTNLRANGGPEDMDTVRVWQRPLRRVQG